MKETFHDTRREEKGSGFRRRVYEREKNVR
jgi:hypothetical protein